MRSALPVVFSLMLVAGRLPPAAASDTSGPPGVGTTSTTIADSGRDGRQRDGGPGSPTTSDDPGATSERPEQHPEEQHPMVLRAGSGRLEGEGENLICFRKQAPAH